MLARYLKAQLLVLLCGGLVGPIFLVVYFTLGLGSLLQWMLYVGLLITVADVVVAIGLAAYGAQSSAKTAQLEQNGVLALAQITGLTETGTWINNQQVVEVHLHFTGPGFLPFDSEDRVIAHLLADDAPDPLLEPLLASSVEVDIAEVEPLVRAMESGLELAYLRERPGGDMVEADTRQCPMCVADDVVLTIEREERTPAQG